MLSWIEDESKGDQYGDSDEEMQPTGNPQQDAAYDIPRSFHTYTSMAPGTISRVRHCRVIISPSIITSTGSFRANSTRFTFLVSQTGCSVSVPQYSQGVMPINP